MRTCVSFHCAIRRSQPKHLEFFVREESGGAAEDGVGGGDREAEGLEGEALEMELQGGHGGLVLLVAGNALGIG